MASPIAALDLGPHGTLEMVQAKDLAEAMSVWTMAASMMPDEVAAKRATAIIAWMSAAAYHRSDHLVLLFS